MTLKPYLAAASICALSALAAVPAMAQSGNGNETATAGFVTASGENAGTASLVETVNGVLITAEIRNIAPGAHAFHIHETGKCEPDFQAAGGHFAPDGNEHGFANPNGYHAGDMPNIFADSQGVAMVHIFKEDITLGEGEASLFDEDGSAFIVHADADNYTEEASAGGRVACAVIKK